MMDDRLEESPLAQPLTPLHKARPAKLEVRTTWHIQGLSPFDMILVSENKAGV